MHEENKCSNPFHPRKKVVVKNNNIGNRTMVLVCTDLCTYTIPTIEEKLEMKR